MRTTNSKTNTNTNAKKITAVNVYEIIKNGGATLNADGVAVYFFSEQPTKQVNFNCSVYFI